MSLQPQQHGYIPRGGQIVDASIVEAAITQTNSKEREALNWGETPEGWSAQKRCHTDRDARWTNRHGKSFYGDKLHVNTDRRYMQLEGLQTVSDTASTRLPAVGSLSTRVSLPSAGCGPTPRAGTRSRRPFLIHPSLLTPS